MTECPDHRIGVLAVKSAMPLSDDDLCRTALEQLKTLAIRLDDALRGSDPSRTRSSEVAREMRHILAGAEKSLGDGHVEPIRLFVAEQQFKVNRIFGTSGWDEPTRPTSDGEGLRVGMAPASAAPLTDEEIAHYALLVGMALGEHGRPADVEAGQRLIAELTRLRSDAWLVAAARELSVTTIDGRPMGIGSHAEAALDILRKHRDGKA